MRFDIHNKIKIAKTTENVKRVGYFNSFISTYAQAPSAETYDDKITYLEKALDYCSYEESVFQQAMKATILEEKNLSAIAL